MMKPSYRGYGEKKSREASSWKYGYKIIIRLKVSDEKRNSGFIKGKSGENKQESYIS